MEKETPLARLNKLMMEQHKQYRMRMLYIAQTLHWGWMLPRWMMRGRR